MPHQYFIKKGFEPALSSKIHPNLGMVVVIPSFNEPNLWSSLKALMNCELPKSAVEVLVVVNYPEGSEEDVKSNATECIERISKANELAGNPLLRFYAIEAFNLPKKHAGVGLARKTGMDEAAWRLLSSETENKIIACFDADSTCSTNYLVELENLWQQYPKTSACSIRYEHPIEGNEFDDQIYKGIAQYELHLRYYVWAGRFIGHPFSFHTVGSSMACSADTYLRFGGMNKNKAGEDFYFLQKIIPHGNFRELNSSVVYPSPRPSYRVPFGTGRAMTKYLESDENEYNTYNFDSFLSLKQFFEDAPNELFGCKSNKTEIFLKSQLQPLKQYLEANEFIKAIDEINSNTSNSSTFRKRFFLWFDAFKLLKYLNFANESYFQKQPISLESKRLAQFMGKIESPFNASIKYLLSLYRDLDTP